MYFLSLEWKCLELKFDRLTIDDECSEKDSVNWKSAQNSYLGKEFISSDMKMA